MTALEVYESVTGGGGTDFARVIAICEEAASYCLIGGLAVNCYVEPVYTMDAGFAITSPESQALEEMLKRDGFTLKKFEHSLNAQAGGSGLRIQFTNDSRYVDFPKRATRREVLEVKAMVASVEDVTQGKLWAWSDATRRLSKRKKDELDLVRLAEAYPHLKESYPPELKALFG